MRTGQFSMRTNSTNCREICLNLLPYAELRTNGLVFTTEFEGAPSSFLGTWIYSEDEWLGTKERELILIMLRGFGDHNLTLEGHSGTGEGEWSFFVFFVTGARKKQYGLVIRVGNGGIFVLSPKILFIKNKIW